MTDEQLNDNRPGMIYEIPPQIGENRPQSSSEKPHLRRPAPEQFLDADQPSDDRHSRKCHICCHSEREEIEQDFLMWRRPKAMCRDYDIPEYSLYRHAHAYGLFGLRRENMRLALDRVIERGAEVENTGDTVIRAVRAQACLTEDNHWVEPAKHVVITTESVGVPPAQSASLIASSPIRNSN